MISSKEQKSIIITIIIICLLFWLFILFKGWLWSFWWQKNGLSQVEIYLSGMDRKEIYENCWVVIAWSQNIRDKWHIIFDQLSWVKIVPQNNNQLLVEWLYKSTYPYSCIHSLRNGWVYRYDRNFEEKKWFVNI